jgi:hypothetical protein
MGRRNRDNPTKEEFAAILNDFAMRGCSNGCKCLLCREFDLGYRAGLEEGAEKIAKAIQDLIGRA